MLTHRDFSSRLFGLLRSFADHPALGDNAGTIAVVDSSSRIRRLSTPQAQILGLAWTSSGKEVWFSGSDVGGATVPLISVDLSGHGRVVARTPGRSIVIRDIARDGHVLVSHENERLIAMAFGPGQPTSRRFLGKKCV